MLTANEAERRDVADRVESLGFNYDEVLRKAPPSGTPYSPADVYWATLNLAVVAAARRGDLQALRRLHRAQAFELQGQGKPYLRLARESALVGLRYVMDIGDGTKIADGKGCCDVCEAEDGRSVDPTSELAAPSLPHEACPKGICPCEYAPTFREISDEEARVTRDRLKRAGIEITLDTRSVRPARYRRSPAGSLLGAVGRFLGALASGFFNGLFGRRR